MMNLKFGKQLLLIAIVGLAHISVKGQNRMPDVMDTGTLEEQMQYINDRTRIYENYRAIREDIFQKMKNNSIDSLNKTKGIILSLNSTRTELESTITDLNNQIKSLSNEKEAAIENRDSLMFFGISMTKSAYNKLLWSIIIVLFSLTVFVFLLFKRSNSVTRSSRTDLEDIKKEFEEFRRVAHENKEKLIVGHFNEIKKLKGMGR